MLLFTNTTITNTIAVFALLLPLVSNMSVSSDYEETFLARCRDTKNSMMLCINAIANDYHISMYSQKLHDTLFHRSLDSYVKDIDSKMGDVTPPNSNTLYSTSDRSASRLVIMKKIRHVDSYIRMLCAMFIHDSPKFCYNGVSRHDVTMIDQLDDIALMRYWITKIAKRWDSALTEVGPLIEDAKLFMETMIAKYRSIVGRLPSKHPFYRNNALLQTHVSNKNNNIDEHQKNKDLLVESDGSDMIHSYFPSVRSRVVKWLLFAKVLGLQKFNLGHIGKAVSKLIDQSLNKKRNVLRNFFRYFRRRRLTAKLYRTLNSDIQLNWAKQLIF
jgi:hypothetical protein